MYGGLGIAALTIVVIVDARRRPPSKVPDAKVVSASAERRRTLLRWLPALLIVGGLVLFYWSYIHKYEYVFVSDGANGPDVTRRYGTERVPNVTLAPGVTAPDSSWGSDPVWVINRSTRTVHVKTINYGRMLGFGSDPRQIPPNTSAHFLHIDHVGPSDVPPHEVRDEANIGMSFREWLTWD
jgi:hypothetical protein